MKYIKIITILLGFILFFNLNTNLYASCTTSCVLKDRGATCPGGVCYSDALKIGCWETTCLCDGWASPGSVHCNTDNCYNYRCDSSGNWVKLSTTCCSTCTPGACTGCTPTTPAGYSSTPTGCSTTTTSSCTGNNGCSSCTKTSTFYLLETNIPPTSAPANVQMTIGGDSYTLSTDINNPTPISTPSTGEIATITLPVPPAGVIPATASSWGYRQTVDAKSSSWNSCTTVNQYDFCNTNTNQTTTYTPTTSTLIEAIEAGTTGTVTGYYYSVNNCDTTKQFSTPITTYYIVNNEPEITNPTEVVPTTIQKTTNECEGQNISGQELNNPLPVTISAIDLDGNDQIQTLNIIFSTDSSAPTISKVYTENDPDTENLSDLTTLGVMIRKSPTEGWDNPQTYTTKLNGSEIVWGRVSNGSISGYATIQNVQVSTNDGQVTATFNISFNQSELYQNDYNIYIQSLDQYMYNPSTPATISDTDSWIDTTIDWDIDTISPSIEELSTNIKTYRTLDLTWNASDSNTEIIHVLGDAFVPEDITPSPLTDNTSGVTLTPSVEIAPLPSLLTEHLWLVNNTATRVEDIDIQENEEGYIQFQTTVFDRACNINQQSEEIDLGGWYATKGGIVFSSDEPSFAIPNLSEAIWDDILENFTAPTTDITDRLMTIGNIDITYTSSTNQLGAITYNITPTYNLNNETNLYTYLKTSLQEMISSSNATPLNNILYTCDPAVDFCYMTSDSDIVIPDTFDCSDKIIFETPGNISISPDILNSDSESGCFFLAGGNITIQAGEDKSAGTFGYDLVEGYLIAGGNILSNTERDGIEVHGGLIALNNVSINRNLQLYNTLYPMVAISNDPRYVKLSEQFFGTTDGIYKQEVGFKSL